MKRIVFFGECMLESSQLGNSYGGDTLNTAVYLARLTCHQPIRVSYATALGTCTDSDYLINSWKNEGIDTQLVKRIANKYPGRYVIHTDRTGERSFSYDRNNSAAREYFSLKPCALEQTLRQKSADFLYISGISIAILRDAYKAHLFNLITDFREKGGRVIFDNNYRPALWTGSDPVHWYSRFMRQTDLALLTYEDEVAIHGRHSLSLLFQHCDSYGINEVVVKRGKQSALMYTHNTFYEVNAHHVRSVVDTCAAGDAFAAGFLSGWLNRVDIHDALNRGHALAARVIQHHGAIMPVEHMYDLISA